MTGNIVFLGFAAADPQSFSVPASLTAIVAFLAGALAGGRRGAAMGWHRARLLTAAIVIEFVLFAAALAAALFAPDPGAGAARYALIVPLALAMGVQNATARRLGVPDLTTTVLTLTLTGIAANSALAGGPGSRIRLRLAAALLMLLGAAIGALLIARFGVAAAIAAGLLLLAATGAAIGRHWSSEATWTKGT